MVFAVSQVGVPKLACREVFACLGAICIGFTSWTRLIALAETRPFEPGGVEESPSYQFLQPGRRKDTACRLHHRIGSR